MKTDAEKQAFLHGWAAGRMCMAQLGDDFAETMGIALAVSWFGRDYTEEEARTTGEEWVAEFPADIRPRPKERGN